MSKTLTVALPSGRAKNTTGEAKPSSRSQRYTAPGRVPRSRASHACRASRGSFSFRRICAPISCYSRRCSSPRSCTGSRGPSPRPGVTDGPGSCSSRARSRRLRSARQLRSSLTDMALGPPSASRDSRIRVRRAPGAA